MYLLSTLDISTIYTPPGGVGAAAVAEVDDPHPQPPHLGTDGPGLAVGVEEVLQPALVLVHNLVTRAINVNKHCTTSDFAKVR